MAASVEREREFILNGVRYPIKDGVVRAALASIYPRKLVIGDTNKDSHPILSILSWTDWTGGIGVHRMNGEDDVNRAWWSTAQLRYKGHMVLPPLATQTMSVSGFASAIGAIGEFNDEIYAAFGTGVYKYDNAADTWGSSLATLDDNATDALRFRLDGKEYLVFAHTNGFTFTSNGTLYITVTIPCKYMAFWDDKLWLVDDDGKLRYTGTLDKQLSETGTASADESNGTAFLDDTAAVFTSAIRDGNHWVRVVDNGSNTVTGFVGAEDPDGDNTKVNIYNSSARTQQRWIEGQGTAFDETNTPLTYDMYTITDDAQLPLPSGFVTDLFVAGNASRDPVLFGATKQGLFAHEFANGKFVEVPGASLPVHPNNGTGSFRWRDAVYVPSGLGIYRFVNGNNAVLTTVGPDRDDGLPSNRQGIIRRIDGSHNQLFAMVDSVVTATAFNSFGGGSMTQASRFGTITQEGFASILGWNDIAWQVVWDSESTIGSLDYVHVSGAYGKYRLWFAFDSDIYFIDLPQNIVNPSQLATFEYGDLAIHETPWFDGGQIDVGKLATDVIIDVNSASATETITIAYATDFNESFTTLGAVIAPGKTSYKLPSASNQEGVAFRAIKFKITLVRGADTGVTPDLETLTLLWRKKLEARWGFTVTADLTKNYGGRSPRQLRNAVINAVENPNKMEFTFRDDEDASRNYWVDVRSASGIEFTGHNEGGEVTLELVEV